MTVERDKKGRWKKGTAPNPKGRPKGSTNKIPWSDLQKALKEVEKEKGKTLIKHFIERAFDDDGVMVSAMKKMLPDLKSIDIEGSIDGDHKITLTRK